MPSRDANGSAAVIDAPWKISAGETFSQVLSIPLVRSSMMKTVRFQRLVEVAGGPEPHLVLVDPAKDRTLQSAVKANRVVTVHQPSTGSKTDHGMVGFDPGPFRQFLVFPRGVGRFKGRQIVGIKYDLLADGGPPGRSKRKTAAHKTPDRKIERTKSSQPLRLLAHPAVGDREKPKRSRSAKSRALPGKRSLPGPSKKRERVRLKRARMDRKNREKEKQARAEARVLASLTGKVRKALEYLEGGRKSPALALLRRALQTEL